MLWEDSYLGHRTHRTRSAPLHIHNTFQSVCSVQWQYHTVKILYFKWTSYLSCQKKDRKHKKKMYLNYRRRTSLSSKTDSMTVIAVYNFIVALHSGVFEQHNSETNAQFTTEFYNRIKMFKILSWLHLRNFTIKNWWNDRWQALQ